MLHKVEHLILLYIIVYQTSLLHSQAPEIQWQNTIGGNSEDKLYSVQQTTDGGYILGGSSKSVISGDKTEGHSAQDYWVVKLNSIGNIQWQNTIGGSSDDYLECVQQTSDGGFILAGYSNSGISGDKTENIIGGFDYWIVKVDSTGNIQWQNTIGGGLDDKLHSIQQTLDGGYILGGESRSDISGDKTEGNFGVSDYWIVKLNSVGVIVWQNDIGSWSDEYLTNVKQTSDGGYIIGGYTNSGIAGDKTEASIGGTDFWVIKLNSAGSIVWQNTIGGSSDDNLFSSQPTSDGGYILGGWSWSAISGDKSEPSFGNIDYWVVKINASGNIQWQKTIGGGDYDYLYSVKPTSDDGYILSGYSKSEISGNKTEDQIGGNDYWILKLNSVGSIIWQSVIGGSASDLVVSTQSIEQSNDGGFIIGGYSNSGISGDKNEASNGSQDYWVVKLSPEYMDCDIPTGLYSDNITSTSAKLHWDAVPSADSYKVFYRASGVASWSKKTASSNMKNLTGLTPSTTYEYKVRSNCPVGTSDFSIIESFTTLPLKLGVVDNYLMIYPNPVNEELQVHFDLSKNTNVQINITDMSGKLIETLNNMNSINYINIDVRNYTPGIYFLKLNTENKEFVQKFIKE